jgi:hypothetical protein
MRATIIGLAALATLAASAALAADPSAWAQGQLREMDAAGYGAPAPGLTFEGTVPKDQDGQVSVTIDAAGTYALVGSCGEDCADIGLMLQQDGKTVAEGVTGFKTALQPGRYVLLVGFDNCKTPQCRYVIRGYRP